MTGNDLRMESLETQLAFQEQALQQLSDALIAQQARIDQLEARVQRLAEQLYGGAAEHGADPGDQPPPHY